MLVLYILAGLAFYGGLIHINSIHKNYEIRNEPREYYLLSLINYSVAIVVALALVYFKDKVFSSHSHFDIKNIILYFLVIDCLYYWIHRITHRTPFLRKFLHETHHDVFHLLPLDFLNVATVEYSMYMLATNIFPLSFLSINIVEYFFVFILILIHAIYCHYETSASFPIPLFIDSTYHRYHHQIGKGNYSVFFPIWDEFMKTRISLPAQEPTKPLPLRPIETKENKANQEDTTNGTKTNS